MMFNLFVFNCFTLPCVVFNSEVYVMPHFCVTSEGELVHIYNLYMCSIQSVNLYLCKIDVCTAPHTFTFLGKNVRK